MADMRNQENVTIKKMSVEIKMLLVDNKSMTINIFKQLPQITYGDIDKEITEVWGWVHCKVHRRDYDGFNVLLAQDDTLFRANIVPHNIELEARRKGQLFIGG